MYAETTQINSRVRPNLGISLASSSQDVRPLGRTVRRDDVVLHGGQNGTKLSRLVRTICQ